MTDEIEFDEKYPKDLMKKIWDKIEITDLDNCWKWNGSFSSEGYPCFSYSVLNKSYRVNRVLYELSNLVNIGKKLIYFTCDNKKCCNPNHMHIIQNNYNNGYGEIVDDKRLLDRFWSKVNKNGKYSEKCNSNCWEWIASDNGTGYGKFWINNKNSHGTVYAHRISYIIYYGNIPDDREIDHLCKNRRCVNPKHLELVTAKENIIRGESPSAINFKKTHCKNGHLLSEENIIRNRKGYRVCKICKKLNWEKNNKKRTEKIIKEKGFVNPRRKLDDQKVLEILKLNKNGMTEKEIAIKFNVSRSTIYNILKNKAWKHIQR